MLKYIGSHVSRILESEPFNNWPVERTVEEDLDEARIDYIFDGHGMSVICDDDENVTTVFLFADEYGGFCEPLFEVPLSFGRKEVLAHFGTPAKSGEARSDPILGEYGSWDRFSRPGLAIHVEYRPDADAISKITLMRSDVVP